MFFEEYFSINIFFIIFRETLECVIIVSVLLAFLEQNFERHQKQLNTGEQVSNQRQLNVLSQEDEGDSASSLSDATREVITESPALYKKLRLQVWFGALCGIVVCLLIGGLFILAFYLLDIDLWSKSEHYWEGVFSILAATIISVMGIGMLQLNKLERKWHMKITHIFGSVSKSNDQYELSKRIPPASSSFHRLFIKIQLAFRRLRLRTNRFTAKHTLFILPFVTTLRECLESILFIGGIGVTEPVQTYGLSIVLGLTVGTAIGILIYKSGTSSVSTQQFMIYSTCLLYLISAGLISKGIWQFELQRFIDKCGGLDVSEVGSGPGSYDVDNLVWHVNCCNGEIDGPWMIFTAIFGWTNSATFGSVFSYIAYWIVIAAAFYGLKYENRHGYLPLLPYNWQLRKIKKNYTLLTNLQKDNLKHSSPKLNTEPRQSQDSSSQLLSSN